MPECDKRVAAKECALSIDESVCESVCESVWEYGCFHVIETSAPRAPPQGKVIIAPLRFVEVVVNGKAVKALKDLGAQIPLISQSLSQEIPADPMGGL